MERYSDTTRIKDTIVIRDTISVILPGVDTGFELIPHSLIVIPVGNDSIRLRRFSGNNFALNFEPAPIEVIIDTIYEIDTVLIRKKVGINNPKSDKNLLAYLVGLIFVLILVLLVIIRSKS